MEASSTSCNHKTTCVSVRFVPQISDKTRGSEVCEGVTGSREGMSRMKTRCVQGDIVVHTGWRHHRHHAIIKQHASVSGSSHIDLTRQIVWFFPCFLLDIPDSSYVMGPCLLAESCVYLPSDPNKVLQHANSLPHHLPCPALLPTPSPHTAHCRAYRTSRLYNHNGDIPACGIMCILVI